MPTAPVDTTTSPPKSAELETPRVSVVMPFRNAGKFLAEALASLTAQTYPRLEILAIDDGSDDDGPAIVSAAAARDPRIVLVREGRRGFVPSLNRGIELARGEFIARMDADDICMPDRFAKQVAFLDANPSVGVVGGQIVPIIESAEARRVARPQWWLETPLAHDDIVRSLPTRNSIYHPTAMLRRDVVVAAKGYRPAFVVVQDYDLWLRLAERTQLANLPDRVLQYRFHVEQATQKNVEQAYFCTWAARHAARERRAGRADPIIEGIAIDRAQVSSWGLSGDEADDQISWIRATQRARTHLLAGRRVRALGAIIGLFLRRPATVLRRVGLAVRTRARRHGGAGPRTASA
ncbi:MAG: glycosyltransferase family 2 protein [Phycisphaerae bacterium]|nr:glycosyltransferase family 2 protein [Phycisphaerae bacterium]